MAHRMPISPQDITDAELAVLEQLWEQGRCTNRELAEAVYGDATTSRLTTVKKLLERLENKQLVARDRGGSVQTFEATVERKDVINRRLEAIADQLCDGSITPLLTHMVQSTKLTKRDRAELRALIDELDGATKKPARKRNPKRKHR